MVYVEYEHLLDYLRDKNGVPFPGLRIEICRPDLSNSAIVVPAHLDSGASRSIFDGEIAETIGLDLLSGSNVTYQSTTGAVVEAGLHEVRLAHPSLGACILEVGFSTTKIARNLLGRDFFDLFQIGFREHRLQIYLSPEKEIKSR
jgi:hypothetical protein